MVRPLLHLSAERLGLVLMSSLSIQRVCSQATYVILRPTTCCDIIFGVQTFGLDTC
jgi:hypothetical protein